MLCREQTTAVPIRALQTISLPIVILGLVIVTPILYKCAVTVVILHVLRLLQSVAVHGGVTYRIIQDNISLLR